jgi:predicted ATP-grasp superfamily ATP-dependent carboligase
VLHLLGVTAAKVKPAGSKKRSKKQLKDKTKLSNILSAAVGLTLQTKRAAGCKRRKVQNAENCYTLAVAKPV